MGAWRHCQSARRAPTSPAPFRPPHEPPILVLKRTELPQLADPRVRVFLLPDVERGFADAPSSFSCRRFQGRRHRARTYCCVSGVIGTACFANVRNGTAGVPSRCHHACMRHKNATKEPRNATRASVQTEMAKPRMARSARIAELNLDTARTPEQPTATMAGTVNKIIPSRRPSQPEQAQIAVDGAEHQYRDLRIDNAFTDEHGDDVKLRKGAHVEVTITAEPKTSTGRINDGRHPTRRERAGLDVGRRL
jgi:hypothetical protein